MTTDEQVAVILTRMEVALDAQSQTPSHMTAQESGWGGGLRTSSTKREAHELLGAAATTSEDAQRTQTLLDRIAGEFMDDDPDFAGFTDFDIVASVFDESRLREVIEEAIGVLEIDRTGCKFCERQVPAATAHLHESEWVGDECCWDERLRASE